MNPAAVIDGETRIIAHVGYPTATFKSPMIYNPYFEAAGINVRVVPFGVRNGDIATVLPALFSCTNLIGALITMPHKVAVLPLLARKSAAVEVAGACNAVRRDPDGSLTGDLFDGEGFVAGLRRKGIPIAGRRALVVGAGGVGSAIAAALAAADIAALTLFDPDGARCAELRARLARHAPAVSVAVGDDDPTGCDIVVNASPLGMNDGDPLPLDPVRLDPACVVGDVVMKAELTPFLRAAQARGCAVQIGTDMLFEQIPAYLAFFGLPTASADRLRAVARISYGPS